MLTLNRCNLFLRTCSLDTYAMIKQHACKTRENSNFLKNGKMVISVKIQNFSSSRMTK